MGPREISMASVDDRTSSAIPSATHDSLSSALWGKRKSHHNAPKPIAIIFGLPHSFHARIA